jgi:molybdopterin-dependent oxidoreductase alpha subunit
MTRKVKSGGGWHAIGYALREARQSGGWWKMWKALRTRNACKTCALGMGGQRGGMVNEMGSFPEVCKKSIQAMVADMQDAIPSDFWATYSIHQLRKFSSYDLEHCGRLNEPVLCERGSEHYRVIQWDEALSRTATALGNTEPNKSFWYFSGRSSNEAGFLLQLFARIYGTNNVNNCSYYCHQASGVGLTSAIGSGTATLLLEDVEHADLVFVIGGNPASNHPRLMTLLANVRRRGGQVIVLNPVRETGLVNFRIPSRITSLLFGSEIASQYVRPHIGGDLALLTGIAKQVVERADHDVDFLNQHCDGWGELEQHLGDMSWDEIVAKSGVTIEEIKKMAAAYGTAKNVVFCWTMGITHHAHGVQNVQAIVNLAMLRGMVGRRHAGLLPIRGHSNVQGIGSVGVTPKLKDAILKKLESEYDLQLPTTPGLDTLECIEAAHAGELSLGICLGGNLYGSNPDSAFAAESLQRLDQLVYLSTTLNTGHVHGLAQETIILPVLPRDEEPQATTQESMFNYVRLSDGGPARLPGPKSEVEVVASLAQRVIADQSPLDWKKLAQTGNIREMIGRVVPGYEAISTIDETKQEFQIAGRTLHTPKFPTATGNAKLHVHQLPELKGGDNQFRLMTVRSEGQFNTVVYEKEDHYRGQDRRDVLLMNPADIEQLELQAEQRVTVHSRTGSLPNILIRSYEEIREGNVLMYFPESNVLISRTADPQSKTPAFKGELVWVESE